MKFRCDFNIIEITYLHASHSISHLLTFLERFKLKARVPPHEGEVAN